jgi:hypothetical protein
MRHNFETIGKGKNNPKNNVKANIGILAAVITLILS